MQKMSSYHNSALSQVQITVIEKYSHGAYIGHPINPSKGEKGTCLTLIVPM